MIQIKNDMLNLNVNNYSLRLDSFKKSIFKTYLLTKKEFLDIHKSLINTLEGLLSTRKSLLKRFDLEIQSCNPKNVLKKGYSILSDRNGKLLKTTKALISASDVIVEMYDGRIKIKKNNSKKSLD
tara:strand:- start:1129 stop:1503 length:375 start_codon:yes stop_codon:yes gene_type:complete